MKLDEKFYQQFKTPEDVMNSDLSREVVYAIDYKILTNDINQAFTKKYGNILKDRAISAEESIKIIKRLAGI